MLTARTAALGAALVVALTVTVPGQARTTAYDLRTDADVEITGGDRVAEAGDINGDSVPDFLVATVYPNRGRTFVVFGDPAQSDLDLGSFTDEGFVIEGAEDEDYAVESTGVGDVNGDGLDDIVVGAFNASRPNRALSGVTYVVFGKATTAPVHLSHFDNGTQGDQGFRIDGPGVFALAGHSIAPAGDVNHDGLADVLVQAPFAAATYVVFGKSGTDPVDLADFEAGTQGDRGYLIRSPSPYSSDDMSVDGAGDVNADGTPDVIIGVIRHLEGTGSAYVAFGHDGPEPIDLTDGLAGEGFKIKGAKKGSATGFAVAGGGDIDGDGKEDVVVSAPYRLPAKVYVVFGKRNSKEIKLRDLGEHGYKIRGEDSDYGGEGSALAGDIDFNADGRPDMIIGAPDADHHNRYVSGSAFVVYGKRGTRTIRLVDMGRHGYRIDGPGDPARKVGGHVASPGDINGDGLPEVLVGTSGYNYAYLQWGRN